MNKKLKNEELKRLSVVDFKAEVKTNIVVVLDNVRSLHNIGAIFRTADAFLIEAIYLCGITAQPPHPEIHKTALGASESVEWSYFSETIKAITELKNKEYQVVALEQAKNKIWLQDFEFDKSKKYAIVIGNEVKGVAQEIINKSDSVIEIPQMGTKHSLNVSISTGMLLWKGFSDLRL